MPSSRVSRSIALALTTSLWLSLAQSAQSVPRARLKVVLPPVPKTAPIVRGSGASRGCDGDRTARAIGQKWGASTWAMTSQTQPTIWAELPFRADQLSTLTLIIYDNQTYDNPTPDRILQRKPIAALTQPGMVAIQLPKNLPTPQTYRWKLAGRLRCTTAEFGPMNDLVSGWLEYKPAIGDLQTQLAQSTPIDQAILYASNGYWLDAVTIVGQNRIKADSKTWDPLWSSLLRSINQADRLNWPIEFR